MEMEVIIKKIPTKQIQFVLISSPGKGKKEKRSDLSKSVIKDVMSIYTEAMQSLLKVILKMALFKKVELSLLFQLKTNCFTDTFMFPHYTLMK